MTHLSGKEQTIFQKHKYVTYTRLALTKFLKLLQI